jgi:hypothetical protein
MHTGTHSNAATIDRLAQQSGLLLRSYQLDFAEDPTSHATESSRSNLIALLHTIHQVYGETVAQGVANTLGISDFVVGERLIFE